jgi:hypothetical protein
MVEAARIELASREPSTRNTTSVVYDFIFISFNSHRLDLNDISSLVSLNHQEQDDSDSLFCITPTISLQTKAYCRRAAIKLLTPIRYRWQLMFFQVFYECKELDSHFLFPLSLSIPIAPIYYTLILFQLLSV